MVIHHHMGSTSYLCYSLLGANLFIDRDAPIGCCLVIGSDDSFSPCDDSISSIKADRFSDGDVPIICFDRESKL